MLGRFRDLFVAESLDGVLDQRLLRRVLGRFQGIPQVLDALGELAREVVLLGRDLAPELVPPGPEHVGPRFDRVLPAALLVDLEVRGPPDAAEVGIEPLHLLFLFVGGARGSVADDGAEDLVAVAEDVGLDPNGVADAALGRVAAVVHRRGGVLDHDPRGRLTGAGARALGRGSLDLCAHARLGACSRWTGPVPGSWVRVSLREKYPSSRWVNPFGPLGQRVVGDRAPALERRTAAFDVASGRAAGGRGLPIRRLDGGGGADVVAGAAARSARSAPLAIQGALGVCRVARVPGFSACSGLGDGDF